MGLEQSRTTLINALPTGAGGPPFKQLWGGLRSKIEAWWSDYKAWESEETFERAFDDQRMTARFSKRGFDYQFGSLEAKRVGGANTEKFPKQAKKLPSVASNLQEKQDVKYFGLDVGFTGVVKRANPLNFVPANFGESRKAEMGLHDLSASLLRA